MTGITFDVMLNENHIDFLNNGKYVRFPLEDCGIIKYIIGTLKSISFNEAVCSHYKGPDSRYCTQIEVWNIVGVEFKDGTCRKFSEVEL